MLNRLLFASLSTIITFSALLVIGLFTATKVDAQIVRPNVVTFLIDDLDVNLFNKLVSDGYMPNVKNYILDPGTSFTNSFVSVSLCCPSRATFLTGQYSHNHGVLGNVSPTGGVTKLDDTNTLATWLHDNDYFVGHIGKYLNGYGVNPNAPPTSPSNPNYIPPGYDFWQALITPYKFYNFQINANGVQVYYGQDPTDYQTDVLTGLAGEFISQSEILNDLQPFFLMLAPAAPHIEQGSGAPRLTGCTHSTWAETLNSAPRHIGSLSSLAFTVPDSFNEADMTDKPAYLRDNTYPMTSGDKQCAKKQAINRAEALRAVDDMVGSVVNDLSVAGELDNTILVFTSDNGYFHGEHRLSKKIFAYDEAIRTPLIIRAPGFVPGQNSSQLVLNNDYAPTIAELTGTTMGRNVDGRSLVPLLQNPLLETWRKRFLVEFLGTVGKELPNPIPNFSAVRTGVTDPQMPNRMYAEWDDSSLEYYDLATDPNQLQSNHADPQFVEPIAILKNYLTNLRTCADGTCQSFED